MKMLKSLVILLGIGLAVLAGAYIWRQATRPARFMRVVQWLRNSEAYPQWAVSAKQRCEQAPFSMPTDGFIGLLWGDSFRLGHRHQGLDIFGGQPSGVTPVYAAYDGYLTREADWKSSLIIRIPSNPLQPEQQIWTYYTHLADQDGHSHIHEDFPPGTHEKFVKAGTLLGYQGNYSGSPNNPVGVHLHFSIVKDDGNGRYTNELEIENTLDPSPYFNLPLNGHENKDIIPICLPEQQP